MTEHSLVEYDLPKLSDIDPDDAMNHIDHDHDLYPDPDVTSMNRAGIDDMTPVDTFIESNGRNVFITTV